MRRTGGPTLSLILQLPLTKYSSLQDLGDIRQLIVCFNDRYLCPYLPYHPWTLNEALQHVVKEIEVWAQQYEADGRYKDAAYLHGRIHSGLEEETWIVPTLAAVYERMGDYPAAELAQEKLIRTMLADGWGLTNEEQFREVKTLSRLLNLFRTRLHVLGAASQTYAKLSIVYRAAVMDLEQLNVALFDQGLIALDCLDELSISSLHIAVQKNARNLVRLLLQKGANLNRKDNSGDTPLHIAVENGTEEMVKLLLDWGADTKVEGRGCRASIQKAVFSKGRNESILLLLIEKGADIETRDVKCRTPLGNAIDSDSPSLAQILIGHGADVNATWNDSNTGRTLLCEAVRQGKEWAVQLLLEKGANPQAVDATGCWAIHYAVEDGQESMVKVLLDHGGLKHATADAMLKTTLFQLAVSGGNEAIVEMILEAGGHMRYTAS